MISSTLLHLAVLIVLAVGLPDFGRDVEVAPPIPVEIATIDELTRPKQSDTANPQPQVAEVQEPQEIPDAPPPPPRQAAPPPPPPPAPAPEPPQQAALPQPAPPQPTPEPEPEPLPLPEPEATPEPKEEEEVKEEPPPPAPPAPRPNRKPQVKLAQKPEKEEEPKVDPLASILQNVERLKDEQPARRQEKPTESQPRATAALPSQPLTVSERDAIMQQIIPCWNPPVGAPNAEDLIVEISASLNQDGSLQRAQVVDGVRIGRDRFYRAAAEAALRAVKRCTPLQRLPVRKYSEWRQMTLVFDPSEMLGQ
ncbi:MAG: hypothetical protein MI785_24505 [Kiloniellales bacterium]|nr:hypothetical protein [Kiloniellales bacterium]